MNEEPTLTRLQTLEQDPIEPPWHPLRQLLLLEIGRVEQIRGYDES